MRTTVTLDPDVVRLVREVQFRTNKTFKEAINSALRSALRTSPRSKPKLLPPQAMGLRVGIDPRDLAGLSDDLEAEAYLKTAARRRR